MVQEQKKLFILTTWFKVVEWFDEDGNLEQSMGFTDVQMVQSIET
jgi:hypothetical protein